MKSYGLSYIVGVLLVLAITVSAVAVYTTITGFQTQTILSLFSQDIRRVLESLIIVEYHRTSDTLVIYNNGIIPTCFVELAVAGMGVVYSNPSCTPIPPLQTTTLVPGLISPPQKFTLIGRTLNNKILTYTIQ